MRFVTLGRGHGRLARFGAAALGVLAIAATPTPAGAIVNIQPLLGPFGDEEGFTGRVDGALSWWTGNSPFLLASLEGVVRYQTTPHRVLLQGSVEHGTRKGDLFRDKAFVHLRWQWSLEPWVTWEVFGQFQHDAMVRLSRRALAGLGPRFEVWHGEPGFVALGVAYVFVHETLAIGSYSDSGEISNAHRASLYATATIELNETVRLVHTTYFQPRLDPHPSGASDLRVRSETGFDIKLNAYLRLAVGFTLTWDSDPPDGIEPLDTTSKVALGVTF